MDTNLRDSRPGGSEHTRDSLGEVVCTVMTREAEITALVDVARTMLMEEIEALRVRHGVRSTAAVALVAERHDVSVSALDMIHFRWTLRQGGLDVDAFGADLQRIEHLASS
jgi:hypothetical protein